MVKEIMRGLFNMMKKELLLYEEGSSQGQCGKAFQGRNEAGEPVVFFCTRKKKHTGPHQWVTGQKRQNIGDEAFQEGTYTEVIPVTDSILDPKFFTSRERYDRGI